MFPWHLHAVPCNIYLYYSLFQSSGHHQIPIFCNIYTGCQRYQHNWPWYVSVTPARSSLQHLSLLLSFSQTLLLQIKQINTTSHPRSRHILFVYISKKLNRPCWLVVQNVLSICLCLSSSNWNPDRKYHSTATLPVMHIVTIFNPAVWPGICILQPEAAKVPCDRRSQDSMSHMGPIFAARGHHGCLWAEPTRFSK